MGFDRINAQGQDAKVFVDVCRLPKHYPAF